MRGCAMKTRVVNVRSGEPYDVYIGRANGRYRLPQSKWANLFVPWNRSDAARALVIARYREHLLGFPEMVAELPELRGKVLACWCAPLPCHGDVLAELADAATGDES